jgi:hypothetical protein
MKVVSKTKHARLFLVHKPLKTGQGISKYASKEKRLEKECMLSVAKKDI